MAGKKSIGDLHSNVTANAQQFVSEFTRADNVARQRTAAIDKELDRFSKSIKRKFSAGDIGKSILQGLGIGSGFALAQTAAEAVANYYRSAAEHAEKIAAASERQLAAFKQRMALRQTDEQELAAALKEQARMYSEIEALKKPKSVDVSYIGREGERRTNKIIVPPSNEDLEKIATLTAQIGELGLQIDQLRKKETDAKVYNALTEFFGPLDSASAASVARRLHAIENANKEYSAMQSMRSKVIDSVKDEDEQIKKLVESYEEMADPASKYREEIERINALLSVGKMKAETAARAIQSVKDAMADDQKKRIDEELKRFFGEMDDQSKTFSKVISAGKEMRDELNQMWNSVSDRAGQAFADMVLTGEAAFSDLVNVVARAVVEMIARLAIINPILNMLFGGMSGYGMLPAFFGGGAAAAGAGAASASYAGAFADGGTLDPGTWGIAGENGPEPIYAGSAPLTVIPNGGQSKGGNTYIIDARGTDESVVQRLQAALISLAGPGVVERRALTAMGDARRRGTY